MIIIFGAGINSKIAMGATCCFFPVIINTITSVRGVNPTFLKTAQSFGASKFQTYTKVHLPAMVGPLFVGLRLRHRESAQKWQAKDPPCLRVSKFLLSG